MKINILGLKICSDSEGLSLKAYVCPGGVVTIGKGTTKYPNGSPIRMGDMITRQMADEYLARDCAHAESIVIKKVEVDLNENQFSALVSLVYNIGSGNFGKSTLLKKLNAGDYTEASKQFLVWRKAGGKILKGLEIRRAKEKELFDTEVLA